MSRHKKIFVELTKLAEMTLSTPWVHMRAVDITFVAFHNPKPLFTAEQKPTAARLIEKSLPLINIGFLCFCKGMNPDRRQGAQISRSGLQYMIDEFADDQEVYEKLKPIFDSRGVKCVEEDIKAYTGIPPEHSEDDEMDLTKIPSSHFWWFFVEEDDDDDE